MKTLILTLLTSLTTHAAGICDFPVPNYQIPETDERYMNYQTWNAALSQVERVYAPIFQRLGCPLVLIRNWRSGQINAQAYKWQGRCYVEIFGGLARHRLTSPRALQLIACHEIGHHLGGYPYYYGTNMSVEGQSDYYATNICGETVRINFYDAALQTANLLAELGGEPYPRRETPAQEIVWETLETHPRAQCRLDTYDAGGFVRPRPRCWYAGAK